jgi:hypothetical protein
MLQHVLHGSHNAGNPCFVPSAAVVPATPDRVVGKAAIQWQSFT